MKAILLPLLFFVLMLLNFGVVGMFSYVIRNTVAPSKLRRLQWAILVLNLLGMIANFYNFVRVMDYYWA